MRFSFSQNSNRDRYKNLQHNEFDPFKFYDVRNETAFFRTHYTKYISECAKRDWWFAFLLPRGSFARETRQFFHLSRYAFYFIFIFSSGTRSPTHVTSHYPHNSKKRPSDIKLTRSPSRAYIIGSVLAIMQMAIYAYQGCTFASKFNDYDSEINFSFRFEFERSCINKFSFQRIRLIVDNRNV